jgi:hypothetical protein
MTRRCSGPSRRVSFFAFESGRSAGSATDRPYFIPQMPSLIRRILGRCDDNGPPPEWAKWQGPWHVWCVAPRARRVRGGEFVVDDPRAEHDRERYVLRGLTALHLLGGEDHVLASRDLADVLAGCCPDALELFPADVMDAPTGKHLLGYVEVRPREQITREEILRVKSLDARVWRYESGGSHLFASKPVMHAIQERRILGLHFLPGLSSFFA